MTDLFKEIFKLNVNYNHRVFGLDLMRALAIIFVMLGHGLMLEKVNTNFPWIKFLDGVELFFVLSGFLIGGILIKIINSTKELKLNTIINFWIRRWFRTLPNYYLVLVLNVIVVYFGLINENIHLFNWKYLLFLQNFTEPQMGFFLESWSLSVEEWFYFLFPIILIITYFILIKMSRRHIFLVSLLIFLIVPFLLRYFIASQIEVDRFWLSVKIYKVVIYRFDGIALGLLAAYVKYWYPNIWYKSRNVSFIIGITVGYLILYSNLLPNGMFAKVYLISIQSFAYALLLPKFESIKTAPTYLLKPLTHISLISYSMYLINLSLVAELIRDTYTSTSVYSAWALYFSFWLVVIAISTIMYKYYEKPITDLRDRFKK